MIPMLSSNTPSRVHITIYQDDVPPSRKSNKRILSDEMDVTPHSRKIMRNRSPSQSRTPMNSLRNSGKPRVPLCDKVNLTPYNPQRVLINKSKSTTPKTTKTVTFSESHTIYENDVTSASKKFKNESGQIVNINTYRRRIEQLEAELRNQIDENQKQNEEIQKYRQEIERALERAKYAALSYKNELYGPVYIDGDHTSINKLLRHLSKIVGQEIVNRFREETLVDDELPALNQIFAWFEESGFLKYEVLKEFRAVEAVFSMDLTYTFEKIKRDSNNVFSVKNSLKSIEIEPQNSNYLMQNANRLVSVFGLPNGFKYLKSLKLSCMPIKDSYFNNFRGLNLEELVIDNTGIGDEALAYLVALRDNLCLLNVTGNKKITDDSILILVLFEKLMVLLLDDTSISMDGIRKFVSKTASTELSQISIPSSCREYLNKRKEIYCVEHKQGMKVDPLEVKFMNLSEIRQQLKFHYEVNTNINIVGSKEELEELLREILRRRRDDAKAMLLTGGRD